MVAIFIRVVVLALAVYLLKISLSYLEPYQSSLFLGVGLLVVTVPYMLITHKSFRVSWTGAALASVIGILFAISYIMLAIALQTQPLGFTEVVSHAYIPIVVILSWLFLGWQQWLGTALALVGVALLVV